MTWYWWVWEIVNPAVAAWAGWKLHQRQHRDIVVQLQQAKKLLTTTEAALRLIILRLDPPVGDTFGVRRD